MSETTTEDPVFAAIDSFRSARRGGNAASAALAEAEEACGSEYVEIQICDRTFRVSNEEELTHAIDRCFPTTIKKIAEVRGMPLDDCHDAILSEHYKFGYSFAAFDSECKTARTKFERHMQGYTALAKAHGLEGKKARCEEAVEADLIAEKSVFAVSPTSHAGAAALLLHMANYLAEGGDPEPALAALTSTADYLDPKAKKVPHSDDLITALSTSHSLVTAETSNI